MIRDFFNTPPFTMISAAPEGSPPRRISNKTIQKNPCPPCLGEALRRGSIVYITIFMVLGVNPIDSCLFLPSQKTISFPK